MIRATAGVAQNCQVLRVVVDMEHLLHCGGEQVSQRQGEREGRGVALRLDRVDGLAGDAGPLGQLGLGETVLAAEPTHLVAHSDFPFVA